MTPYVRQVLDDYRRLPQATGRLRPSDRALAEDLQRQGIPLHCVQTALCLAALRRLYRPPDALPLPPIRSLHYIRPILDELLLYPTDSHYLTYLQHRLRDFTHPETGRPLPHACGVDDGG